MIDPYHMFMARRPSLSSRNSDRKPSSSNSSNTATPTTHQSGTPATSGNSDMPATKQNDYIGGASLSPASTASLGDSTTLKSSVGGSSASSGSLQHKLPEFEHFRQSSPLMPEFYPRTSDFFSQGRRKSLAPSDGSATGTSAADAPRRSSPARPSVDSFKLPLTFQESETLKGEQLPVRLGLAPPSFAPAIDPTGTKYKTRVGYGYYFYTPPPTRSASGSVSTASSAHEARRDTSASDSSIHNSKFSRGSTSLSAGLSTLSPAASNSPNSPASNSSDRQGLNNSTDTALSSRSYGSSSRSRASSSVSGLQGSTLVGPRSTSSLSTLNRPPASPDCWRPERYFHTLRSRVKGKMRDFIHHAFPRSQVPYWHGYNKETMDAELATHLNVGLSLHGNTLREFHEGSRPCRVLDLGCGKGTWCLDVAREWKTSEFVGVDIVPVQPPLSQLSDPDLEQRVTWVIANFLEPLPFPDACFDFVHMRFLLQAIPEDKWVDVISEARRVLAPGGVLEIMEGNYIFFGHSSLVDAQELKDLESGKAASKPGTRQKLPKRLKVLGETSEPSDVDVIEVLLERMMHRRFINATPLSVIPSMLVIPGFSSIANGNPRHIPIYAESSAQRAKTRARDTSSSSAATSSEDEEKWKGKFTNRTQIGKALNSSFVLPDQDLFAAFNITQNLEYFSSSRELIWQEAEEEKRNLQGQTQPELKHLDTTRGFGQGNPAALQPFAHPWKSKDQFFRALDNYIEATLAVRDMDHILEKYLGWEQGSEELTVEGRKHAERQRKMSISAGSLGFESSTVAEEAEQLEEEEKADAQAALQELDRALSPSAYSVATTGSYEAPARLQTTISKTSFDSERTAQDQHSMHRPSHAYSVPEASKVSGTEKASEKPKKKKLTGRPSSSGGIGSSSSASGRNARAFGRGGAGGGAALPLPLPDAPSFMAGYAFGPSPADPKLMFRGPAQKGKIEASGRSTRTPSNTPSLSDRSSSYSGRTEKDERKGSLMTQEPIREETPDGHTAASAYAASKRDPAVPAARVSHGLDEEYRMQPANEARRPSRPVSPTSGLADGSGSVDSLGHRPPLPSTILSDPARSVSMPAKTSTASGGHSVRIVEPPSTTSQSTMKSANNNNNNSPKESRPKSKAAKKPVAMLGFYDVTGFLAIA